MKTAKDVKISKRKLEQERKKLTYAIKGGMGAKKMNTTQLANIIGLAPATLYRKLADVNKFTFEELLKISEALELEMLTLKMKEFIA